MPAQSENTRKNVLNSISFDEAGPPRYEQVADFVETVIGDGRVKPGDRLPTVRQMAQDLGVSTTTITSAFNLLRERGLIQPEVGRGTFVLERQGSATTVVPVQFSTSTESVLTRRGKTPWRRRALMSSGARLRAAYPHAIDCSTGRPDVSLLPLDVLRRAWKSAIGSTSSSDLQYAGPEAMEPLAHALTPLLERDGVAATGKDLVVGSSAQQLMVLCLDIVCRTWGTDRAVVAVEEPGYPTIVDAYERAGARMVGIAVDEWGAVPESLDQALAAGARMVVFTPRAHNPTGASWSPKRLADLADVLAARPESMIVEDDQFAGIATTRPGSLFNDERLAERVVYIRSFSKSIGPDLRMAVAVARPRQRALIAEAKGYADGWTSRLLQRSLAVALADRELTDVLDRARDTYRRRREGAAEALNAVLSRHGGGTWCGPDGVNLWVRLPPGVDSAGVVERAAAAGVLVAPGEPFYIRPGHGDVVRLNAGSVPTEKAAQAGRMLAEAILSTDGDGPGLIHV